jgi:hypothetical protein
MWTDWLERILRTREGEAKKIQWDERLADDRARMSETVASENVPPPHREDGRADC